MKRPGGDDPNLPSGAMDRGAIDTPPRPGAGPRRSGPAPGWGALAWCALGALLASGCAQSEWGKAAPFEGEPAPLELPPPTPPGELADKPELSVVEHIFGNPDYPCDHPICAEASPEDGTVGISVGSVEFLDPNLITETEGTVIAMNLFEGLLQPARQSGRPYEPGVATGYHLSDDQTTYTFTLRQDARWSDGRPVTAHDFAYSWLRKLNPETGSVSVEPLYWIKGAEPYNRGAVADPSRVGIRVIDDHTLEVELEHPVPFWLSYVATSHYLPVPRETIETHGRAWTRPENIVTNGPYRLVEFRPRDRIVMEREANYWDVDNVRIPRAVFYHSASASQDMIRYEAGQLHWARGSVPPAVVDRRLQSGEPDFFIDPLLCYYLLMFQVEREPLTDRNVRRAINMAIDKQRLVHHITRTREIPATGPVMPHFEVTLGYPKPEGDPHDITRARQLLADAGYPNGAGFPRLSIVYNTDERHKVIAEFVQRQLKEGLNIETSLENMEFSSLLKTVRMGDFDIARRGWCGGDHPYTMLEIWRTSSPRNTGGYSNPEYDRLTEASMRAATHEESMSLLAQAEAILQQDAPIAPLFYYTNPYLKKPVLRGLLPHLSDLHPIKYMWWGDKDEPPQEHVLDVDTPETRRQAAEPPPGEGALLDHIHGIRPSWPCEGHPVCDEPSPADGTLGVDIGALEYLDPSLANESEGFFVAINVFEGLVAKPKRSGMPLEPAVAERWEISEDGLTYTFHLREDARWSNDRVVTAEDFVYAWRRKLDPATASPAAEPLYRIKNARAYNSGSLSDPEQVGVRAVDDRTLEVTLEAPNRFFLDYLASGHFLPVPREAIEAHGRQWTRPENIVSNGAYRLVEWVPRSHLRLVKSETYWDADSVRIPAVMLYYSDSQSGANTRYETGTIQWGRDAVNTSIISRYLVSQRPDFFIDPFLCYYGYLFRVDKAPFDDLRVRRAFNMAIDKERLINRVVQGRQLPADGPMLPHFEQTAGYPKPKGDPYDPDEARRLLADAGYPRGAAFPLVSLVYNTSENHRLIAEFVQRQLAENLGVRVELRNMEWGSLLKTLRAGDFEMARFGWCGSEDPHSMMSIFQSFHPMNLTGWDNPEFDELLERASQTLDPTRQMELFAEAERLVQQELPIAPIYYYTRLRLKKPVLQGLEPELTSTHLFKYMYWADREEGAP